ncbi:MAG: M15 family metallopeptidase [Bacteroidales bacterium]|nr:M15 family metallopeptidase [Bacteroidales bacterium]MCM1415440.1 M15 family metallopeptidase [bacterium]MCM1422913.1 M15 family metallopeptidase [bacterium]
MHDIKSLLRQAAGPALFLLTLILICAFLARFLTGSETLSDYAHNNPELAYGTQAPDGEEVLTDTVNSSVSQTTDVSDFEKNGESTPDHALTDADTADNSAAYPDSKSDITEAEKDTMTAHINRTIYQEGFFYEPLTDTVKERITGISYPESGCTVPYEDLRYVGLKYIDFDGQEQIGELICNQAVAQDMVEIFYELYRNDYRLERVCLIDAYDGDDTASMSDNNTSCFNYRVVDGTTNLSKHAYGLAIDVNPYYNPYVVFGRNSDGSDYISPPGSEIYADRSKSFPYKIDENDLCYRLFTEHGFTWGGNWNSTKDYQHFQKTLD